MLVKSRNQILHKKCICGSYARINYITKIGRVNGTLIQVLNVPVYVCNDCDYSFMIGSDSIKFAKKVQEAYDKKMDSISF